MNSRRRNVSSGSEYCTSPSHGIPSRVVFEFADNSESSDGRLGMESQATEASPRARLRVLIEVSAAATMPPHNDESTSDFDRDATCG